MRAAVPFPFQQYGATHTIMRPRRSCRSFWGWKSACTKEEGESMDHVDRRLGIPSRLGAMMQIAQDRAHPRPAPLRRKGFAFANRACKHVAGARHAFGSPPTPPPAAGKGPEEAQAPQEDHGNVGRHVLPPHIEELQGGVREAQPAPRRAGVRMPGQEVRQKLYARLRVQAQAHTGEQITTAPGDRGRAARCRTAWPAP